MTVDNKKHESPEAVSLYLGCVIPNRYPMIEKATRSLLDHLNIKIKEMNGASCCPAPGVFRGFDIPTWLALGARNVTIAEDNGADLCTMCNGCYGTLLEVDHKLKHDTKARNEVNEQLKKINRKFKGTTNVKHIVEILYFDVGMEKLKSLIKKKIDVKVGVHYGCHLLKPTEIRPWGKEFEAPTFFDDMIELTGAKSIPYKEKMMCCGAGGGVRTAVKEVSLDFTREKLVAMREAGVDIIVTACPFCHLQLDLGQVEINQLFKDQIGEPFNIPVIYITQLLGAAMGLDNFATGLKKMKEAGGSPFIKIEPFVEKVNNAKEI
jgi:heterodisulfide reductase subunit B